MNFTREGVLEAFEIYPDVFVEPGTYDNTEVTIVGFTNQGAPVSYNNRITVGGVLLRRAFLVGPGGPSAHRRGLQHRGPLDSQ